MIVASYGGSGSTFLVSELNKVLPRGTRVWHVHAAPLDFLGVPVFNRFTGHSEGPFSRHHELPLDVKVIFIYRDPARAMRSRGCFQHFMHLWSETDEVSRLFESEAPSAERFRIEWKRLKGRGDDVFRLERFFQLWESYASKRRHEIAFLKYEELDLHWGDLLTWLGLPLTPLKGFEASKRDVSVVDMEIYRSLQDRQAKRPGLELVSPDRTRRDEQSVVRRPLGESPKTVFRVLPPRAGAADAFSRIGLAYDVLRTLTDSEIQLSAYANYHSPNTDFLALFNVSEVPGLELLGNQDRVEPTLQLSTSELIYWLLLDPNELQRGGIVEVEANEYPGSRIAQNFQRWFPFSGKFAEQLTFTPSSNPFVDFPGVNAVIHLRRGDISVDAITKARSPLARLWQRPAFERGGGSHARPLLRVDSAVKDLKKRVPRGTVVNVVIVSDGFERQKQKYRAHPSVLRRIKHLEKELRCLPTYPGISLNYIGSVVGDRDDNTVKTLDAMFFADLIYTSSSSFVSLITNLREWRGTVIDPVFGRVVGNS